MDSIYFKKHQRSNGSSKVLFSCNPQDFDTFFDEICKDIFDIIGCSIYYSECKTIDNKEEYLSQLNEFSLFVFPITKNFLSLPSIARDIDYKYAINKENMVAVLPILVENNLYDDFNNFDNGNNHIQVLDKTANDPTQDPYEVKLSEFIKAKLLDNETTEKIKKAFDAYIFLSYRKKDRKYAQEVMSSIHDIDFMEDVAIWYDEFLTIGDRYDDEINKNLLKSNLMALVVTPNIYAKALDGNDNYVVQYEYPNAKKNGKSVLPIRTLEINSEELNSKFDGISYPIDKNDIEKLSNEFTNLLFREGIKENNDPEHLYFVGLAYLNGVDIERNPNKAIKILEKSLASGYVLSGITLFRLYYNTIYDYQKAIFYADKTIVKMNENYTQYLSFLDEYYKMLFSNRYFEKAIEINELIYTISDELTKLGRLNRKADLLSRLNKEDESIELRKEIYSYCIDKYGEKSEITEDYGYKLLIGCVGCKKDQTSIIKTLEDKGFNLYDRFSSYSLGENTTKKEAKVTTKEELLTRYQTLSSQKVLSQEIISVCQSLSNLYKEENDIKNSVEMKRKCYLYAKEVCGVEDKLTDRHLRGLLHQLFENNEYDELLTLCKNNYDDIKEKLGNKNPKTRKALTLYADFCKFCKKFDLLAEIKENIFFIDREVLGKEMVEKLYNEILDLYKDNEEKRNNFILKAK